MAVFCVHLVIDQPQTGASGVVRQGAGGMDRTSRTKITPCWVTLLQQPGGPPCWASPLAFDIISYLLNFSPPPSCYPDSGPPEVISG